MRKFFINGVNISVIFCRVSDPSRSASSSCPSVSKTFDGTRASIIRRPIEAKFALLLPLCGVPRKSTACVDTNIECRCSTSLLVLLAEYASACCAVSMGSKYIIQYPLTLLTTIPPNEWHINMIGRSTASSSCLKSFSVPGYSCETMILLHGLQPTLLPRYVRAEECDLKTPFRIALSQPHYIQK